MSQAIGTEEGKTTVQERILNAAEELFARNSFAGTRISEIALKAEVNQAMIHYYFDSKEKLYQEVLARLFQHWEQYVRSISWDGLEPESIIREYIKVHYELKCQMPNLYKIFHWEALEGGELFNKYASSTWVEDFLDKTQLFKEWKQAGIVDANVNETILLFSLWGMMNQFYYRDHNNLTMIVGKEGSAEQLQAEIVEQMVQLTLRGVLVKHQLPTVSGSAEAVKNVVVLLPEAAEKGENAEAMKLLDKMSLLPDWEMKPTADAQQALEDCRNGASLFVFASTKFGEVPARIVKLLHGLEQDTALAADRFVGLWVTRDNPASESLQRTLEDAFNRLGAFAIARVSGQSPRDYMKRCAKWIGK
ncbi:TetR/AcrR family transcriptional regulator [Paenibacillus radicis (ex Gao et al. 2016)]|uniref:HTH tetR-type domain-containing protein n=1 Tax=Paenibacillus radicis (ex Gao et al. 2016) TaxID=1737354 RepID=A0A917LVY5_9BACL|nr:TetR family transcriptional regulator C-terminal domain-containing protein [Paenibacillus radicis (ex Gao et al. 2016)]GGG62035.1 hypothetical protein GCM10010918_14580 [Paenibacillus radicis (ex Gao et al. 2016)]